MKRSPGYSNHVAPGAHARVTLDPTITSGRDRELTTTYSADFLLVPLP